MTANPELPSITCPSSLVASCAPLLGYEPSDCLVAFILGVPGHLGPVLLRVDLAGAASAEQHAEDLAASILGTGGCVVDVVAWVDAADDAPRERLPCTPLIDLLADRLIECGVDVGACLSTNGSVWWSHECPDVLCCGGPQALDSAVLTRVRAEYVFAGFAPLPSREVMGQRIARDDVRAAKVARSLRASRPPARPEQWRDAQIAHVSRMLVPGGRSRRGARPEAARTARPGTAAIPMGAPQAARVLRALADIRVRDTVLLRLIVAPDTDRAAWAASTETLCDLLRAAPPGHGAPPATLLGLVAWMSGQGVLANLALDRAEQDDPDYRLASLARQVMVRGIDPRIWRASMSGLTEGECRNPRPHWGGAPLEGLR